VAAGGVKTDISTISLNDLLTTMLKTNKFSHDMSSPSAAEVSPENHTIDGDVSENHNLI